MTGGAGYIGSHTVVELLGRGAHVTIVDSLANACREVLSRIALLGAASPRFHQLDVRETERLTGVLKEGIDGAPYDAVIHFAGRKAVAESVEDPLGYWDANVNGTLSLLQAMERSEVRRIVFSSSATVYGAEAPPPFRESLGTHPVNPYGRTKLVVEQLLQDVAASDPRWSASVLRYFNPVGAHPSGQIGEDPLGTPNNLMPYLAQVAVGRRPRLRIFGDDYPTPDGTGIRDYIHVLDLARGHVAALSFLEAHGGCHLHNLGTGRGHSVLEVLKAFEDASGRSIPYEIVERRPGDIAAAWADTAAADRDLGWRATLGLTEMCRDAWHWQATNPAGYRPGTAAP